MFFRLSPCLQAAFWRQFISHFFQALTFTSNPFFKRKAQTLLVDHPMDRTKTIRSTGRTDQSWPLWPPFALRRGGLSVGDPSRAISRPSEAMFPERGKRNEHQSHAFFPKISKNMFFSYGLACFGALRCNFLGPKPSVPHSRGACSTSGARPGSALLGCSNGLDLEGCFRPPG